MDLQRYKHGGLMGMLIGYSLDWKIIWMSICPMEISCPMLQQAFTLLPKLPTLPTLALHMKPSPYMAFSSIPRYSLAFDLYSLRNI